MPEDSGDRCATGQDRRLEARKRIADGGDMALFDLNGRAAVVTGGNGGIGLGMAKGLAQAGAAVAIAGRNAEKAKGALQALGPKAVFVEVDIADAQSCRAMVAGTVEKLGRLDVLVNNAGINDRRRPELFEPEAWRAVLDVNLSGAFFAAQAAYPEMKRGGGGKIVNIGSMMSIFGASFAAPYAASKGGIVQLTRALATAWAADGIQVNAVLPGWIDTELTRRGRQAIPDLHDKV